MELDEIEHKIACNEMTASQVFTQMKQHIDTATGAKKETEEKETLTRVELENNLKSINKQLARVRGHKLRDRLHSQREEIEALLK
jgi:hypothetical protein